MAWRVVAIALVAALGACGRHKAGLDDDDASDMRDASSDDGDSTNGGDGGSGGDGGPSGDGGSGGDGGSSGVDSGSGGGDGGSSGGDGGGGDGGSSGSGAFALGIASTHGAALAVAIDAQKNVYVVGFTEGDISFAGHPHYQIGYRDAFIASFTVSGAYRWSKTFGYSGKITGSYAVAVDGASNVYMTGIAASGANFGGGAIFTPQAMGQFVASFDTNGAHRWSRIDGGNGALGLAMTGTRVFTIGRFTNSITLGTLPPLVSSGAEDVVVAAFDTANGSPVWARKYGTAATDYEGNLVAHEDWIAFSMHSTNDRLVSITSAGADRWSTPMLVHKHDMRGLAVDASGNLYLSGRHRGGGDIVPGTPFWIDGDNIYLHSYTSLGASRWSWTLSESPARDVYAVPYSLVTVDALGRPTVAGTYKDKIYAGGAPLVNSVQAGRDDIFLSTFASDGTPIVARKPVDVGATVFTHGVAIDADGRTYVAGIYWGVVDFGNGPLPFASSGGPFLLRYVP